MDSGLNKRKLRRERASAGHQLGSAVGDWFERYFVLPVLGQVAQELDLFLDNRFIQRPARGAKILWQDEDRNIVDYDFVLELQGSHTGIGIPVGFVESFWRRGARHSKDKARDDSGKLRPMRVTYPTARFLGIVAGGDFTSPARELVLNQQIDLFYVPKIKLIESFKDHNLIMDYADNANESVKQRVASDFEQAFTEEIKLAVADSLINNVGVGAIKAYVDRIRVKLSSPPQEIRFILRQDSQPVIFDSVGEATDFLASPRFIQVDMIESYVYQITYSDGTEFERSIDSFEELCKLHGQMVTLANHMDKF